MSITLILVAYAVYVILKIAVIYFADKKLREAEAREKNKIRVRRIRVREVRPDRNDFPF